MMMHRAWAACALVLLLWPAAPAWADTRTDARRYFNRGMEAIQEGRTREGIDLLEQAYELRPHPNVLFNIARAYASLNEVDDAVRYFDKYLESNPPDRGPTDQVLAELRERQRLRRLVDDGMNAVASGRYIEGVALLARAYAERPHPNLLFNIGRAYESAGEFKQAVEAYQGYLESKPPDSAQVAEKVRVLEEKVRSQAARAGSPVASAPPTKTGGGGVARTACASSPRRSRASCATRAAAWAWAAALRWARWAPASAPPSTCACAAPPRRSTRPALTSRPRTAPPTRRSS